VDAII